MKYITLLFALLIVVIIVLADLGKLGFLHMLTSHNMDKVGHFLLYGMLTLLLDLTLLRSERFKPPPELLVLQVASILALFIGLEEYSQQFFAKRTFSLLDLTFSYLGVLVFSWMALRIKA